MKLKHLRIDTQVHRFDLYDLDSDPFHCDVSPRPVRCEISSGRDGGYDRDLDNIVLPRVYILDREAAIEIGGEPERIAEMMARLFPAGGNWKALAELIEGLRTSQTWEMIEEFMRWFEAADNQTMSPEN